MKRLLLASVVSLSLLGALPILFGGCDKKVAEEKTESTDANGTTHKDTKEVTKDSNGNTTVTKESKVAHSATAP